MRKGETAFSLALCGVAGIFFAGALGLTPLAKLTLTSDGAYPLFVGAAGFCAAMAAAWSSVRRRKTGRNKGGGAAEGAAEQRGVWDADVLVLLAFAVAYLGAIVLVHYALATLLFLFFSILYLQKGQWKRAILVGFITTNLILLVFEYIFQMILP